MSNTMTGIHSIHHDRFTPTDGPILGRLADVVNDDGTLGLIMELSGKLQTTLEVDTLIELFAQVMGNQALYDSLDYHAPTSGMALHFGQDEQRNKLGYNLKVLDTDLGQIVVSRNKRYNKSEIAKVENFLAALLYPLRNALLYQTAIESAFLDSLTGIKNRTAFDSNFNREIELNRRKNSELSLVVMDIDFFKRINDQYGHAVGDLVLKQVAKGVEETIRSSDALYRYGGEEFVVVLNGTDQLGARLLAERIRENIESLRIESLKNLQVTLSLGVSMMNEGDTAETLFKRADEALYVAKNQGRNQVVMSE
ncbi:MAG: GGDEF domain-containing protein [Candidatus Thiodiazotropha lotti]|nr:GGDEF domain-containing protein [Candidatus Thiodiazotropha endoloripes]MCG7897542.1 GGDEF domain-containing protein [Candidatus Thiodiazotropha weberae]MCG7990422.1 GGDEF domain-containing protein [Candidatus Thiodiazotropha lotti]MCG7999799.1 GGDEF domain-containing protein [Candidatus Thiodiazotropha lotti]MCW4182076.1 GGDEF domain-containing protein [Candidatus Thiodiazotropha weberae]MCW4191568.1 GGDEF domain-containing protein [Candidatus Thiodiazotropha weberae]